MNQGYEFKMVNAGEYKMIQENWCMQTQIVITYLALYCCKKSQAHARASVRYTDS